MAIHVDQIQLQVVGECGDQAVDDCLAGGGTRGNEVPKEMELRKGEEERDVLHQDTVW